MSTRSANSAQKALCWQGPSGIQEQGKIVSSLFHFLTHNFLDDPRKRADRLSQVPTVAVDSICPCLHLQFHWFLWKYLSTSFGHHIYFSQDGVYFKSTGARAAFCIKKCDGFFSKDGHVETQNTCRIFDEKEEVYPCPNVKKESSLVELRQSYIAS